MNKRKIFLSVFSCAAIALLLASCTNTKVKEAQQKPPVDGESDKVPQVETTIEDAYEDTRPNYEEDFDFIPDYMPEGLPNPDARVLLTLSDQTSITFKDGSKILETKPGHKLTVEEFDLRSVEGRNLVGVSEVLENGEFGKILEIGSYVAPKKNATILPILSDAKGYESLMPGSDKASGFNFDGVPGSINENRTIQYSSNYPVSLNNNIFVAGARFNETSVVTRKSAFRLDTRTSLITKEGVYEFTFNFENKGKTPIHFDLYQISSSSEYKKGLAYESRYRIDIDLEPGEKMTVPKAQYKLDINKNALSYFVANKEMKGFDLGVTMAIKATDLAEPETVSPPKPILKSKITLDLPEGVAVGKDYVLEGEVDKPIVLPTNKQISNTTGRAIEGWYIKKESIEFIDSTTLMPEEDVVISPYFAPEKGVSILPLSARGGIPDYYGVLEPKENEPVKEFDKNLFSSKGNIINGERSVILSHSSDLLKGEYFRMLSSVSHNPIVAGTKYNFYYTFHNYGNKPFTFNLIHVQKQVAVTPEEGAVESGKVVLQPGETKKIDINILLQNNNQNVMTIISVLEDISKLQLGIKMSMELDLPDPSEKYTLTLGGKSCLTFENNTNTIDLAPGESLPKIVNNTGRELEGLFLNGTLYTVKDFKMPPANTTITPCFAPKNGFNRVWAMSGSYDRKPNNTNISGFEINNFEAQNQNIKQIPVNGTNNVIELGLTLKHNGLAKAGSYFRTDTKAFNGEIPAGTHTYSLNYENLGKEKISFDVYFVNSGKDKTSCTNNHFILELNPGAAITIEVSPTYAKKNGNILTLYETKTDLNSLDLRVSMSVKYNTK